MANGGTGQQDATQQKPKPPHWVLRYLKDLGVAYQKVWTDQLATWGSALDKIESGNYSAGQWIADIARSWDQWAKDVWLLGFPLQRFGQGEQIPTVAFVVDPAAECADPKQVPLPVAVSAGLTPAANVITPAGGSLSSNITAAISEDCTQLSVGLKDLKKQPIVVGGHRALVCVEDKDNKKLVPLAIVEVLKVPSTP